MNPVFRCGLITFIAGLLACFAAAANAAQAEVGRPEIKPGSPEFAAYEQALKHEQEQAQLRDSAWRTYNRASDVRDAAHRHRDALKALLDDAQERKEAFARVSKAALQAEQAKHAVLAVIAAYAQASDAALQAAAAFAEARGEQRAPRARAADEAAARRAQALEQALAAVEAAAQASDSLRSGLASIGYRSAQLAAGLPKAVAAADAFALKSGEFAVAVAKISPNAVSPQVIGDAAQVAKRAARLRDEAAALGGRLKLMRDLSREMQLAREQEPARALAVGAYFEAESNAAIEAAAGKYVAAVRKVSLKRCQVGSACRIQLDEELAAAEIRRIEARDQAAARLRVAMANIDATVLVGRRIEEYADVADSDPQTLEVTMASAAEAETLADKVRAAALGDYQRANEAYGKAKQAADAAYLAAYGKPRHVPEVEAAMAAPAPRYETAAKMSSMWQVETHAWEFFTATKAESKGYGAYTYVLFGRRLGSKLAPQVKQRYAALLDAVIASTPHRTEMDPKKPHDRINLFCIPGKTAWEEGLKALDEGDDKFPALDNYASSLALSVLSTAGSGAVSSLEILEVIGNSPGPFLLTAVQPISQTKSDSPLLFVDLSRFPPSTYADLVTAYKRALVERPPQGQQTWEPPAFQWVATTGTGMAGHLVKVKNAVTGWLSFGEGKPAKTAVH